MLGTCESMCPEKEAKLRIKEHLLHFYEYKNGQKNVPGTLVKCFSRSAAGAKKPTPKDLRTNDCLLRTVEYLLESVLFDQRKPYHFAYDFVFDRLRAVRQETVMQNLSALQTITLLQPITMFLAFSRYRLCEEPISKFDPKICEQHLQECLKRVLCCYDSLDSISLGTRDLTNCKTANAHERILMEALYLVFNIDSDEALRRSLTLPIEVKNDKLYKEVKHIALNCHQGNFYRALNGVVRLPHVLNALAAAIKIPVFRRNILERFASAYNSKKLTVPIGFVCGITKYENEKHFNEACGYYNISRPSENCIQFVWSDFKGNAEPEKPRREQFVEQKLKNVKLTDLLMLKDF